MRVCPLYTVLSNTVCEKLTHNTLKTGPSVRSLKLCSCLLSILSAVIIVYRTFCSIFAALVLRYCYILHTNPSTSTMSSHSQHSTRFRFGSLLRSLFFYDWLSVYGQRAHATILITFRFMMVPDPLNSLKICRYVESRSRLAKR